MMETQVQLTTSQDGLAIGGIFIGEHLDYSNVIDVVFVLCSLVLRAFRGDSCVGYSFLFALSMISKRFHYPSTCG